MTARAASSHFAEKSAVMLLKLLDPVLDVHGPLAPGDAMAVRR